MKNAQIVFWLVAFHAFILLLLISELSISYYEANIYFNEQSLLHYIINLSTYLLGENDYALRLPMIIMHSISALLYYDITKPLFKKSSDQVWNLLIYLLLPGVNSAAIMVDGAGLVLFLLLLFLFVYKHWKQYAYALLPIYVFVDASFAFLYLAFIFYAMEKRRTPLLLASLILFAVSMYLFGIEIGGHPKNHFLATLGIYAAIFSPIVFIYLIYALYRWGMKEERTLLWYLAATAFIFSLLLSFRQQMKLEELAPYILVATPLMVKTFLSSYRVRLREFRRKHRVILMIGLSILVISTLVIFFNKSLYLFIEKPSRHFVYNNHIVKELSEELKELGIKGVYTRSTRDQLRLRFYGIAKDESVELSRKKLSYEDKTVTVRYVGQDIAKFYVTKLYK